MIPEIPSGDDDRISDEFSQPLDKRVIEAIKSIPDRKVRPAHIAKELGISVNDACAELCGLLAVVGGGLDGASFKFEKVEGGKDVMIFDFPTDFEARALRNRRAQDFWATCRRFMSVALRFFKILTAFGLILSLLILCIAAILSLVALLVALSRDDRSRHHQAVVMQRLRALFFTMREILWFYAIFGPNSEGNDPILREMAYDLSLALSCCCGNPFGIFYWMRASQLSRRRYQAQRRWGRVIPSEIEGVSLVRTGSWRGDDDAIRTDHAHTTGENDGQKGILSVAVEFLFGPEPASPDNQTYFWKVRAAVITQASAIEPGDGVSLATLSPYMSDPPESLTDGSTKVVEQGLTIVAHFNGIPVRSGKNLSEARFAFPELMAESAVSSRLERTVYPDNGSWEDFLFTRDGASPQRSMEIPEYLNEERYRFTNLSGSQLSHCTTLGFLNLLGVIWLGQSVSSGGILPVTHGTGLHLFLLGFLIPVLRIYAVMFLAVPAVRLGVLVLLNKRRAERNRRRQNLLSELKG